MAAVRELPGQGLRGHRLAPPRRLLAALSDERLAERLRQGDEVAFELLYDRHHRSLLGFCRNMLRSQEEADDAVQQIFISAYRALTEKGDRPGRLKPWLYAIGRNRCISMLRSRREDVRPLDGDVDVPGPAPFERAQERSDLRAIVSDLRNLPEAQRTALVLTELGGFSHAEVAEVLECKQTKVRALVFQGRATLIRQRAGRAAPCHEIREEIANLTGARLRGRARQHAKTCTTCADFAREVRAQRQLLALALPVVPSLGLKRSVLAATTGGGGGGAGSGGLVAGAALKSSGAGGAAASGGMAASGGAAGSGALAAVTAKVGITKAAAVALAAGGVATGVSAQDGELETTRAPVLRSAEASGLQGSAKRGSQASPEAASSAQSSMVVGGEAPAEEENRGEAHLGGQRSVSGAPPGHSASVDNRETAGTGASPAFENGSPNGRGDPSESNASQGRRSVPQAPSEPGTSAREPQQDGNSASGKQGGVPVAKPVPPGLVRSGQDAVTRKPDKIAPAP